MSTNNNLSMSEMLDLSMELWKKNKDTFAPMDSKHGKTFILYMVEEIGEVISVIKRKGEQEIMNNPDVREHFVEELGDVIMYFMDVLNRFNISAEEFSKIYTKKFNKNISRNYIDEYTSLKSD